MLQRTRASVSLGLLSVATLVCGGCYDEVASLASCEWADGKFAAEGEVRLRHRSADDGPESVAQDVICVVFDDDYEVYCEGSTEVSGTFVKSDEDDLYVPFACSCEAELPAEEWFCQAFVD